MSTSTSKYHKRTDTYEGPQMTFKFPSDEDLAKVNELPSELGGPPIEPFFKYNVGSPGSSSERGDAFSDYLIPPRSESTNYFSHTGREPSAAESFISDSQADIQDALSSISGTSVSLPITGTSVSLPTQDNVSYQITSGSSPQLDSHRDDSACSQQSSQYESILNSTKSQLGKKTTGRKASLLKRSQSMRSENYSLYRNTSLKRSKAVKYKVGWLTRLKNFGIKIKTHIKNWRIISKKKSLKFSRLNRKSVLKKSKISMPLEREQAQSISELRREINDWYTPKTTKVESAETLPLPPPTASTLPTTPSRTRISPPPLPTHRIVSNPSIQKAMLDIAGNSSRYSEHYYDEEMFVGKTLDPFTMKEPVPAAPFTELQAQSSPFIPTFHSYPSNPRVVVDEEGVENDGFDSDSSTETAVHEDTDERLSVSEDMFRQCWTCYLSKVISNRINSKLEFHRLSTLSNSSDTEVGDSDYEECDIISDYATSDSYSDILDDSESLTSVSSAEYSETDESSYFTSEISTEYFSTVSGPNRTPRELALYEQVFMSRQKQDINVKRSSTLPSNAAAFSRIGNYQVSPSNHNRFLSMIP